MLTNSKRRWNILSYIFTMFALLTFANVASASHFRGGQISWTIPDPIGAPFTVEFTVTQNWHDTNQGCNNINFGDSSSGNGCTTVQNIGSGTDSGGRGYAVRQYIESHTYANAGEFTVSYQSCCRIGALANGGNDDFRVGSVVQIGNGNIGGPNVALAAVNTFQIGGVRTINIPAVDPDGDAITCRFATDAETSISPSIPSVGGVSPTLSNSGNTCVVEWDLTGVAVGAEIPYVLAIVFESEHNGVTSTTQADTTAIVSASTTVAPVCSGGGSFSTTVGVPFSHTMTGTKPGETLTVTSVGAPAGSSLTPVSGSSGASPLAAVLAWTPTAADLNATKAVIVRFSDSASASADCLLTLTVSPGVTPTQATNIPVFGPFGLLAILSGLLWFGHRRK